MSSYDRFAPESYEDFLCHGKTARECAEIRERLRIDEQAAEAAQQRIDEIMAEEKIDLALAADYANKALAEDGPWARFFHGLARFYWSRANA